MPVVTFTIEADGKDVTGSISPYLTEMTITDGEGLEADTLQIVIDDKDGSVEPPRTGAVLRAVGGYVGRTRDFGTFCVDSVAYEGYPQRITIGAQSVAAKELAKQKEPKSFTTKDFPTYGDVYAQIAGKLNLSLAMSDKLKSIPNASEFQSEENGLEFLTRIGAKINAAVTVKSGRLVAVEKGAGQSASGAALDYILVQRGTNLISYQVTEKDEPKHSEVEATYYDRGKNSREVVTTSTGLDGPKFLMRASFQEKAEAERAASAKAKELVRSQADGNFSIDGEPFAQAEAYALVTGIRSRVDGKWRVKQVVHHFSGSSAYTTDLQCEVPSP